MTRSPFRYLVQSLKSTPLLLGVQTTVFQQLASTMFLLSVDDIGGHSSAADGQTPRIRRVIRTQIAVLE